MTWVNSLGHVLFPFARWQYDHVQTPLPCAAATMTRAWAVATARRPWAGLTVCVYMDVHVSGSRSLPCAATLCSTYLVSGRLAPFYIHQMNRVNSRNGSAMMMAP